MGVCGLCACVFVVCVYGVCYTCVQTCASVCGMHMYVVSAVWYVKCICGICASMHVNVCMLGMCACVGVIFMCVHVGCLACAHMCDMCMCSALYVCMGGIVWYVYVCEVFCGMDVCIWGVCTCACVDACAWVVYVSCGVCVWDLCVCMVCLVCTHFLCIALTQASWLPVHFPHFQTL
jgi:hypothetical protein